MTLKRGIAPKTVRSSSDATHETEIARVIRERDEALEQQTAISDILRVISNSPSDVQPVLNSVAEHAARICEAHVVDIAIVDNEVFRIAASFGELGRHSSEESLPLDRSTVTGRSICDLEPVHVADVQNASAEFPLGREMAIKFGHRTILSVPLIREGRALGAILVRRTEVRPFEQKHIALLMTFADQAAIAIENVRLFQAEQERTRELRQRTTDLTEALEQQTATSEVLQVISSSPGDLQSVFAAMLENAVRICDAKFGNIYRWDGEFLHLLAAHNTPAALAEFRRRSAFRPLLRMETKTPTQIVDLAVDPDYVERRTPHTVAAVELGGVRSLLSVPLLKENELIGSFSLYRPEVHPFTDKQIELVQNFAAQAVIAIENTRLLNELRESLQQQTATADVLKVISRSTFDLQTVLHTLVESAARLCAADKGTIQLAEGDVYRVRAHYGLAQEAVEYAQLLRPVRADRGSAAGRVALEGKTIQIPDVLADPEYHATDYQQTFGYRTILGVPLLRDGKTIGSFSLLRDEVSPFTDKQIELVTVFADQAVIAIENSRLFEAEQQRTRELSESLEQQTATSKVLEVISRSAFDLQAVFEALAESSVKLCAADRSVIYRLDGELLKIAAAFNVSRELREWIERNPIRPSRHGGAARAALERRTVHIPDILADPEYTYGSKAIESFRTVLGVPILKGDEVLGVILIYHLGEVRPFTDKQIALVETFADQAAIAIENVRLLDELRHRTDELGRSVEELRALGEVSQAVNSTLDLETVLSTIVAKAVQLSGTEAGAIYVFDELQREFHLRATYGMDQELIEALTQRRIGLDDPNLAQALAQPEPTRLPTCVRKHLPPLTRSPCALVILRDW